jgi:hypothetical protein
MSYPCTHAESFYLNFKNTTLGIMQHRIPKIEDKKEMTTTAPETAWPSLWSCGVWGIG